MYRVPNGSPREIEDITTTGVLTNFDSGRNDRVVADWQAENLVYTEEAVGGMMEENPEAEEWFRAWESQPTT